MKNTIKLLGIIAIAAVIGFLMASCDSGGGTGGQPPAQKARNVTSYTWTDSGDTYALVITEPASRAVTAGTYVMTVVKGGVTYISTGTATGTTLSSIRLTDDDGTSITLNISVTSGTSITVTVTGTTLGDIPAVTGGGGSLREYTEGSSTGGSGNWDGNYESFDYSSPNANITKVNTSAKTITGVYVRDASYAFVWDANHVISNVTFGSISSFPSSSDVNGYHFSGQWAYVNQGTDKIGIVSFLVMKDSAGTVLLEQNSLLLCDTDKNMMRTWTPLDGSSPQAAVDLSDVQLKGFMVDAFFDK